MLQSKNVSIETINEHMKLNEKLNEHSLFFQDIDYGKEITSKLYNIQDLEWKETGPKDKCKKHSKRISKYKDVVPLTEDIAALGIGVDEYSVKCYSMLFYSILISNSVLGKQSFTYGNPSPLLMGYLFSS
ncbi:MAG: hypothetical protein ACJ71A_13100 [Nitrososphaeraceae archaeon]